MATMADQSAPTNWPALIEAYLLAGLGAMLLVKTWTGQLPLYIHPRYSPLIFLTSLTVLLLGVVKLRQVADAPQPVRGRVGMYGLLLAPLALGLLLPVRPAGSALVDPAQLNTVGQTTRREAASAYTPEAVNTGGWNLLDWTFAGYNLRAARIAGKPVDVIGFVYHKPDDPDDHFHVVRYTLSCCVADRSGLSLPVRWSGAAGLEADTWVRVTGTVEARDGEGRTEFVVSASGVESVAPPDEPYLYYIPE